MHGLSTILSLIFKLFGKIFRLFGINVILTIMFIIELISCIGYAVEMYDYDSVRRDYKLTEIESVVELDKNDPVIDELDLLVNEHESFYLVRVKIENRYSERLSIPAMSAETENGDIVIARRVNYYGEDFSGTSVSACVPEGTQTVLTYLLEISDYKLKETDTVKLYDFSKEENQSIIVPLPK